MVNFKDNQYFRRCFFVYLSKSAFAQCFGEKKEVSNMNKVVHFEVPFDDKERAKKFYSEIFNWDITEMPEIQYTAATTTPTEESGIPTEPGAINGALVERTEGQPNPVITIEVDSIDEHIEKIKQAGGEAVSEKGEVPEMGYYLYFKDSEGNVIGLWENMSK